MKHVFLGLLMLITVSAQAQVCSLQGRILDSLSNEPLAGASIRMADSRQGTFTASSGSFFFLLNDNRDISLIVSYIGYDADTIVVKQPCGQSMDIRLLPAAFLADEIIIMGTRIYERSPLTAHNISKSDIQQQNAGYDLPYIMQQTPSLVTTSDAGTGIGYTGLRIRGTDLNRINVTLNGVPFNDPESHGVFLVDMPDIASGIDNIQIQRGVGTSTNGAGAFGGSINIETNKLNQMPYVEWTMRAGSFNTFGNTLRFGTGLLKNKWTTDVRLSKMQSDGFIDRGWSNLSSLSVSSGYYGKNTIVKVFILRGQEQTYQAWAGIPQEILDTNRTYNPYTYENETDNYNQNHYHLVLAQRISDHISASTTFYLIDGIGYYEQYKEDRSLSDYGISNVILGNDTIEQCDLIQRKYLENLFYGNVFSFNYDNLKNLKMTLGGGINRYDGDHYGTVVWSQFASDAAINHQWYFNRGLKSDANVYLRGQWSLNKYWTAYADAQLRHISFSMKGFDDDLLPFDSTHLFTFFNPKAGIYYNHHRSSVYASIGVAHREPNRDNFKDARPGLMPQSEQLTNLELGYILNLRRFMLNVNAYYMAYKNQLVLTGQINDVGAAIMINAPASFRRGVEIIWGWDINRSLKWEANLTLSQNKILDFTAFVDDYDQWPIQQSEDIGTTDISFSPSIIAGSDIGFKLHKKLYLSLQTKYVGKQYIDNTSSNDRMLKPYLVNNLVLSWSLSPKFTEGVTFRIYLNNFLNEEYETNAWVYRWYEAGTLNTVNGLYPQAGFHVLGSLEVKL